MVGRKLGKKELYLGLECKAKFVNSPDAFVWGDIYIPIRFVYESPYYWIVDVLPHKNPNGQGISHPYKMTIHKRGNMDQDVILRTVNFKKGDNK